MATDIKFPGPTSTPDPDGPDQIMTIDEVSQYLSVAKATLYKWRVNGYGPPAFKLPHTLRYSKRLVDRWLLSVMDDWGEIA